MNNAGEHSWALARHWHKGQAHQWIDHLFDRSRFRRLRTGIDAISGAAYTLRRLPIAQWMPPATVVLAAWPWHRSGWS